MAYFVTNVCLCLLVFISEFVMNSVQVPAKSPEKLFEELNDVKNVVTSISEELNKFSALYLSKLENSVVTAAHLLGNIDSNVKNLQERAHVWDTFQLHVAAWNEQISTLDKKVDSLSRGQDKFAFLDGKLSSLVNLDYKVERLVRKMDEADNKLSIIVKILDNQRNDPLFSDFTTRGILSTLKTIEKKVENVEKAIIKTQDDKDSTRNSHKFNDSIFEDNIEGGEHSVFGKGKLTIKCNTPMIVEELLHDVASKVDVIFDKISQEEAVVVISDEPGSGQAEEQKDSVEDSRKEGSEADLINKIWRRFTAPQKKIVRLLETIEKSVELIEKETRTGTQRSVETLTLDEIQTCCKRNGDTIDQFTTSIELLLKRVEQNLVSVSSTIHDDVPKHFRQQEVHFEGMLQRHVARRCGPRVDVVRNDSSIVATRFKEWGAKGCEALRGTNSLSGVYSFGERDVNAGSRDFSTRYCQMDVEDGGWTVIQRRGYYPEPRQNFSLSWKNYKIGFGHLDEEFWFGNDFIHRLVVQAKGPMILRVELESFDRQTAWAQYSTFSLGDESDAYRLRVGGYTGNATDSLSAHDGIPFSTGDRTNDEAPPCCPCAAAYGGGWWFNSCFEANLNGEYFDTTMERDTFRGIIWEHWLGDVSLRSTRMMIRPIDSTITTPSPGVTTVNVTPEDP